MPLAHGVIAICCRLILTRLAFTLPGFLQCESNNWWGCFGYSYSFCRFISRPSTWWCDELDAVIILGKLGLTMSMTDYIGSHSSCKHLVTHRSAIPWQFLTKSIPTQDELYDWGPRPTRWQSRVAHQHAGSAIYGIIRSDIAMSCISRPFFFGHNPTWRRSIAGMLIRMAMHVAQMMRIVANPPW